MTVKMRAPAGMSGISFQGVEVRVEKGLAEIPDQLVAEAQSHGFSHIGDGGPVDMSRSSLVHHIVEAARAVAENSPDDVLMNFRSIPEDLKVEFWDGFRQGLAKFHEHVMQRDQQPQQPEPQPQPQPSEPQKQPEPQKPADPAKK